MLGKRLFRKHRGESLDVDEVFFDSHKIGGQNLKWEDRLERPLSAWSGRALWAMSILLLVFFAGRSLYLSGFKNSYFSGLAQSNYVKELWQRSPRGVVYSSDLTPLVGNVSIFNLVAIPAEIPTEGGGQENIINFIGETFGKDRGETLDIFANINRFSFRPVPIATDLSRDELLKFESNKASLPGLRLEENFKREYPYGSYFSHVLGYTGLVSTGDLEDNPNYLLSDITGKSGIELVYEDTLRGEYGKTEIEITSLGVEGDTLSTAEATAGSNLVLFIDDDLQRYATDVMARHLRAAGTDKGALVVLDPRSGGVLAMQSFPLYDSNVFSGRLSPEDFSGLFENNSRPLFNRAVGGLYPPGSTIKPFIGTAGLEEGVVDEQSIVNVDSSITVAGQEFVDWRLHGIVDIKDAIAVSSNVFFYAVGGGYRDIEGLGPYRIKDYLSRFGFDRLLNIDLPGERAGLVPDPAWKKEERDERWYIGDTYNISIGQGDMLVSPLGLASALSSIANNGTILKPRIVKTVTDQDLKNPRAIEPEILIKDLASQDSFEVIRQAMRQTVTTGSAVLLNSLPVSAAAKTGTAQAGKNEETHAWFAAFAPYENPEIVMVVLAEHGGGGASVGAPIASEVLNWYFSR